MKLKVILGGNRKMTEKTSPGIETKVHKYLGKSVEESEDTVGTMTFTNHSTNKDDYGEENQQPLRVGRNSPSMARRQRSWNLGFISDVLENEGLMTDELRRAIAVRLTKLG